MCCQHSGTPVGHTAGDRCSLIFVVGYLKHLTRRSSTVETLNVGLYKNLLWRYQFILYSLADIMCFSSFCSAAISHCDKSETHTSPSCSVLKWLLSSWRSTPRIWEIVLLVDYLWSDKCAADRLIHLWKSRTDNMFNWNNSMKIKSYVCLLDVKKLNQNFKETIFVWKTWLLISKIKTQL